MEENERVYQIHSLRPLYLPSEEVSRVGFGRDRSLLLSLTGVAQTATETLVPSLAQWNMIMKIAVIEEPKTQKRVTSKERKRDC